MAKVKKFEEIQSWKKARSLTKEIYRATLTGSFARDFWTQRSNATRIGLNPFQHRGRV